MGGAASRPVMQKATTTQNPSTSVLSNVEKRELDETKRLLEELERNLKSKDREIERLRADNTKLRKENFELKKKVQRSSNDEEDENENGRSPVRNGHGGPDRDTIR